MTKDKFTKEDAPYPEVLGKCPTGIAGLDQITFGGLPQGRPTLLCGSAGCGKTLLAMEFLMRGTLEYDEQGVFMAFEETAGDLAKNFASLGHDLNLLIAEKKLVVDHVHIERSEIEETGEYDLEGLFIRLAYAIDSIGAKRVVLDTIEALFSGLTNTAVLRAELRRLFRWLKDKGVTAIITAERGDTTLTRYGLEEYVADCVILLDNRVEGQMTTRRLRIIKYRGSSHGTNEYPFLIDAGGISILPLSSVGLKHEASIARVSTGIPALDKMMGGKGFYRASSVLISGTAGSGKTSVAAHFAQASIARGERCLWFAMEESSSQIMRNMRSIGIDLQPAVTQGNLVFHAERSSICGLEMHLVTIHKLVSELKPNVVIIDPISNFSSLGSASEVKAMLTRLIDYFKMKQITAVFNSLTSSGHFLESTEVGVSSLMDTWLVLHDQQNGAERNRLINLLKSRGMAHSNQMREFLLTDHGIEMLDVYTGPSGELLTGTTRLAVEAKERADALLAMQDVAAKKRRLQRSREAMKAKIALLHAEFELEQSEATKISEQEQMRVDTLASDRAQMSYLRQPNAAFSSDTTKRKHGKKGAKL